ncbi:MAG: glucose-1-phosphate thymidylyltransferase [Caldisphaera sp.]|jgi:glucose-1-phosphate thymidylyltransferase
MEAIVLHGGQGTRLRPLTHTGPKQLIKVAGKPVSQWVIEQLKKANISDIIMILGDNNPQKVVEYYGDGSKFEVKIKYIYQGKARGLADAIYRAKNLVGEKFLVYLGDNIVPYNLSKLVDFKGSASILLAKVQNPYRFGVAIIKEGKIAKLIEKPKEPISDYALVGVYAFTREIFDVIENLKPSPRNELEITDAIQGLLDRNREIYYDIVDGWWKDTGTPEDILEANMVLLDEFNQRSIKGISNGSSIDGRVTVEEGAQVFNSRVIGPTFIGYNSIIKDSYIGPYTMIGDSCNIENSDIENSVILDGSNISGVSLRDSLIGQSSKILRINKRPIAMRFIIGERSSLEV